MSIIQKLFLATFVLFGPIFSSSVFGEEYGSITPYLLAGTDDIGSPTTNAVVSLGGCTGTLITSQIVLTAGHCFDGTRYRERPEGHVDYPHDDGGGCNDWQDPTRWYNFASGRTVRVKVGVDQTQPDQTFMADQYSLPGCVDILMVKLTRPVPRSVAVPVEVATRNSFLESIRGSDLRMVGFGTTGLDDLIKLSFAQLDGWSRTADDSTPPWSVYAHAHGTKGLAIVGDNLFGAGSRHLWMRPLSGGNMKWRKIGEAPNIVSMTSANGSLFAATSDNRLLVRSPSPVSDDWRDIGHANYVTGLTSIGNRLFASNTSNQLWVRDATLREVDWRYIGHANDVADLASSNSVLYGITNRGHLWSRSAALSNVNWQYVGDIYRSTWDHDRNGSTPQVDRIDAPGNMVASADDIYVSIKTRNGTTADGQYPSNSWSIRQVGDAEFGEYPHRNGKHFTAIGAGSVRGRPGDSGGPVFWLRPGQPDVLIGVNRQIDSVGARYVATFYNRTSSGADTMNTGLWIEAMANPTRP